MRDMTANIGTVLLVATLLSLGGCNDGTRGTTLDSALSSYHSGRYEAARTSATTAMQSAAGDERSRAAYVAGLSSYRLNRLGEAETNLRIAMRSDDRRVRANATATMGLIRLDQKRPGEAAGLFAEAHGGLTGRDADQAARYAASAARLAGLRAQAAEWDRVAAGTSTTVSPRRYDSEFAIQVGAFQQRENAHRAAGEADQHARRVGQGPTRIIPDQDPAGRTRYLVQFGTFTSRSAAESARLQIGRLDYIVTARAGG